MQKRIALFSLLLSFAAWGTTEQTSESQLAFYQQLEEYKEAYGNLTIIDPTGKSLTREQYLVESKIRSFFEYQNDANQWVGTVNRIYHNKDRPSLLVLTYQEDTYYLELWMNEAKEYVLNIGEGDKVIFSGWVDPNYDEKYITSLEMSHQPQILNYHRSRKTPAELVKNKTYYIIPQFFKLTSDTEFISQQRGDWCGTK